MTEIEELRKQVEVLQYQIEIDSDVIWSQKQEIESLEDRLLDEQTW